jgi:hypothetical protein
MFRSPPFVPLAAGLGLVLFTIFAIAAPLDTFWPLLTGPADYQQTLTEARFIPRQPYVDSGCPWRSVISWRRLRGIPGGPAHFRRVFAEGRTPAARILAVAGLLDQDSSGWYSSMHALQAERWSVLPVSVLMRGEDMIRDVPIDTVLIWLESGSLTRELDSVDLRSDQCWHL